jgi:carboxyl-terminal processing protease
VKVDSRTVSRKVDLELAAQTKRRLEAMQYRPWRERRQIACTLAKRSNLVTEDQSDSPVASISTGSQARTRRFSARQAMTRLSMVVVLFATFGAGIGVERAGLIGGHDAGASSSLADLPEFQTLQETWDLIHSDYVDESAIEDPALIYGAAAGMVDALGDTGHSRFLPPAQAQAYNQAIQGELIGIGVQVDYSTGRPVIVTAIDGSPAQEAGVKSDDVISAVDGKTTEGMTELDLFSALRGEEGTSVEITFTRPAEDRSFTVTLERRRIEIKPVTWAMLPGNVALIRISEFSTYATDGLQAALTGAKEQGATSLILDLRNNPGGLTSQAIGVASEFLPEGEAVYQVQERGGKVYPKNTVGLGLGTDLPMVVLINGGSASAAEIVASALRDHGRAQLIGETTFGTGTQLLPFGLTDGSILVLGTALWLTPSGEQVWHTGVEPSIEVELPDGVDPLRPASGNRISADDFQLSGDSQIKRAYDEVTR